MTLDEPGFTKKLDPVWEDYQFKEPTPAQAIGWPYVASGRDVLLGSVQDTGKIGRAHV